VATTPAASRCISGYRLGEAKIQDALGYTAERQGRYADALDHAEQAA